MEIPELPTLAIRANQTISYFAAIMLHGLKLFLAVTDSLARHAAPFDPHLPIGLAYITTVTKNTLINTAVLALVLIQTLVLAIVQICRRFYGNDASSSPDPQNAVHLPSPAGPQDATISPLPPPHPTPAEDPHFNPPLTGSPVAPEVVNDGNASPSPTSGRDRAVPEISNLLHYMATFLLERYFKGKSVVDLAVSIDVFQVAEGLRPQTHPHRSSTLSGLAVAFFTRYKRSGRGSDLSKATELHLEALSLRRPGEHVYSSSTADVESETRARLERLEGASGLSHFITRRQEAQQPGYPNQVPGNKQNSPNDPSPSTRQHRPAPEDASLLDYTAISHFERYEQEGGPADLRNAIRLFREALSRRPPGHPNRSMSLNNLANAVHTRYKRDGGEYDLEEAIHLNKEALSRRPPGHPNRSISLNNLASAVKTRYERDGGEHDLEEAIQLNREALSLFLPSDPNLSASLDNLATAVHTRYERDGGEQDLEEAIQLHGEALSLRPPGHPDRSTSLSNFANAVLARYERDGGEHDLEEAIQLNREAVSLFPPGHPNRSISLNNLASAVKTRYERDGGEHNLQEAIQLHREALSLRPPGHPDRSSSLNNLSNAVLARYERDGGEHDLEEAIQLNREAVSLFPPGHPDRSASLNNLACAVETRYERDGGEHNLQEAIQLHREALSLRPPGHPDRSSSLNNLSNAVLARYRRDGGEHDLSEAIQLKREAISLRSPRHPGRSNLLQSLANAVLARYERDGGEHDLGEAIQLYREAISLRPPGHPDRSSSLSDLANAVLRRYKRDGRGPDLVEAIQICREALSFQSPGCPHYSMSLTNLANAVLTRYERDGEEHDLEEAIKLDREALSLRSPGHLHRSVLLKNLAGVVQTRYKRDGEKRALEETIQLQREAVSHQPPSDPHRSSWLRDLSNALRMRYERDGGEQDLEEAIQLLLDATNATTSPIPYRLQAALLWITMAVKHNSNAVMDACRSAFTLMGSTLALGRSLQDRYTNLISHSRSFESNGSLALGAALWALFCASPNPKLAVEILDQGRNVLLASVGQFRADLSNVRRSDPALADDFYRISRVLDSTILSGQEISEGKSVHEDATSRYKRVSAQWEDIVAKIRLLPGCEFFLLPVPYTQLQEAAVGGPVIVILVGKERSTAIIVLLKGEPHTVDLPKASEEALRKLRQEMDDVLEIHSRAIRGMGRILSELWEILVQPIIQELQDVLLIPFGSRIWWYPTSWASFLPLHAAGSYRKGGLNVPSLYISSYTPTLQALRRSRGRFSSSSDQTAGPLIVSQADTPGQISLPSVDDEVGIVFSLVPNASLLADNEATKKNVLDGLCSHSWIHLACHGCPDPSDPFKSHFALHDGPLSLQDIITNDLPSADFAFLSACHSAAQDKTLPDEGLALAGGMQFAGFKSVVGTLWAMADEDAPTLAEEFYKGLAAKSGGGERLDCTKAAESLHDAVRELKKQKVPLYRWINLVHYGI